ncbi:helix-turn-helix domain-containing protein [Methanolobus sp. ZRKC2]|uniref:TrmB family transcriptional regulator n=1 Tax=Methanolobus sp. ZRKC2 TaxID=3125783 RepID=UPI00324837CB
MLENKLISLGLNKYEVDSYIHILKHGICEASNVHKETDIPYGKIYETLNSLVTKGLLEVQNSRPKKYMAKKPSIALNGFYAEKKRQLDEELENTRKLIVNIGEEIDKIRVQEPAGKTFWKTAMGAEIPEMIRANFEEVEHEKSILLHLPKKQILDSKSDRVNECDISLPSMLQALERGVRLRIISIKEEGMIEAAEGLLQMMGDPAENVEIRYQDEPFTTCFAVIDNDRVVISIIDPVEQKNLLSMTKIWDQRLAARLQGEFEQMWNSAKKLH